MNLISNQNNNLKIENFELNGSGFRFEGFVNMDIKFSKTKKLGGTKYVDLLYDHRGIPKPQNQMDSYCAK